jgi:RiboL-PSP-HEPN
MNSRDVFEAHYKSAEVLIRVYRLLESEDGPKTDATLLSRCRDLLNCAAHEELILLLNELFLGVVRERADLRVSFFRKENLDLLLRQAVVAACSALDIFIPHLLETHLPTVIRIRQRNFMPPNDNTVKDLFRDFRLSLDEVWPLAEETSMEGRWNMISKRILDYCQRKTLSNDTSIEAVLALLGVDKPWQRITERAGEREGTLRERLKKAVTRRNDIVHRADRPAREPHGVVTPIDLVWTQNHVGAVNTIALACYELARDRVRELIAAAPGSGLEVVA